MSKYSLQFAKVLGRVYGRLSEPKRRHLEFAFDEAEKTDFGDIPAKIAGYLAPRFSKDELQSVVEALQEVLGTDLAEDEPPDFPGKPLTGGGKVGSGSNSFQGPGNSNARVAQRDGYLETFSQRKPGDLAEDSRRQARDAASFEEHFPDAGKIALDAYGIQPPAKGLNSKAAKSASLAAYSEQFGGVAKKV